MSRVKICPPIGTHFPAWSVIALLGFLLATPGAFAQTTYTSDFPGGAFNASGTWTPAAVPGPLDTAIILPGHTVVATMNIAVDTIEVQGRLQSMGFSREIKVRTLIVQPTGLVEGFGTGDTVYITGFPGLPFQVKNDGLIQGGSQGGHLFIHDAGSGGDLPCPVSGSLIASNGGRFEGGSNTGNVYLLSTTIDLIDAAVFGGTGFSLTTAGAVYIAGVDVFLDGATIVESGSNTGTGIGGGVKIVAQSCNSAAGDLFIGPNAVVSVGTPSSGGCPGALTYAANTSTILGIVAPGPAGCLYWDPPALELAGDAELTGDTIILAGSDFDASGLASRTLSTPAIDAGDTLMISLLPGGVLDLRGLTPGFPYFNAGNEILLCVKRKQILTDRGVPFRKFMTPNPKRCRQEPILLLALSPTMSQSVSPGTSVTRPVQVTNISNVAGSVTVTIKDSQGWLAGGPIMVSATLDPGEAILRTLTLVIPKEIEPDQFTVLDTTAEIVGGPTEMSASRFVVVP